MEKKTKKIRLNESAIALDSKKMCKITGGVGHGACLHEGMWIDYGQVFEWKGNICRCNDNGSISCTKKYVPEGCECSCRCFELDVMGFQIGMFIQVKSGNL